MPKIIISCNLLTNWVRWSHNESMVSKTFLIKYSMMKICKHPSKIIYIDVNSCHSFINNEIFDMNWLNWFHTYLWISTYVLIIFKESLFCNMWPCVHIIKCYFLSCKIKFSWQGNIFNLAQLDSRPTFSHGENFLYCFNLIEW